MSFFAGFYDDTSHDGWGICNIAWRFGMGLMMCSDVMTQQRGGFFAVVSRHLR
jgi:hypothetical protein